jgi:RimJ/RimL family protein N-acetyltransferase
MFYSLSEESVYHRFFQALRSMSHERIQPLLKVDYEADMAIVATTDKSEDSPVIGVGRYVLDPKTNMAEVAFLVADDFQRHGLGTNMLRILTEVAKTHGISGFTADVLADNQAMLRVFHRQFHKIESTLETDVYSLSIAFAAQEERHLVAD